LPESDLALPDVVCGEVIFEGPQFVLRATRGVTAAEESVQAGREVAVLDWRAATGTAVAFAASDEAASGVAAHIASLGVAPYRLPDRPGLLVARTLAQLANAAMDAVLEQVSDPSGIDTAMRFGSNYPFGPIEWADRCGRAVVTDMLRAIARHTGLPMYLPSEQWTRS
jgi:3-hydroxybutyryl-CoA dehydrogenase